MSDDDRTRSLQALLGTALTVIVVGGITDLVLDRPDRVSAHVVLELLLIASALGTAAWLWLVWLRAERSLHAVRAEVAQHEAERDAWRQRAESAMHGLRRAIDAQFDAWQLTGAEREVALFILQGHSHKVIARLTGRSERTVRQHAVVVYGKSGLRGRAEFAAFFLDDLLAPGAGSSVASSGAGVLP